MEGECLNYEFNGKVKEYYHNGQLKIECEYVDDKIHRIFQEFHDNGNLKLISNYFIGKKNGPQKDMLKMIYWLIYAIIYMVKRLG